MSEPCLRGPERSQWGGGKHEAIACSCEGLLWDGAGPGKRWQWWCHCFEQDTEILDSAMYRSRANLGRKRGHRAPAIRPGGTLGLSEAAESDSRLFQDSTGRARVSFDDTCRIWGWCGAGRSC